VTRRTFARLAVVGALILTGAGVAGCTVTADCANAGQHFTYQGPPGGMPSACVVTSWSDVGPALPPVTAP
jgi:hypothetical protein